MLLRRFQCPPVCSRCGDLVRTAEAAASRLDSCEAAAVLLQSMQAHIARKNGEGPFFEGRLLPNYLFQQTCQPEPFQGSTADVARQCAQPQHSDEEKISHALRNYGYVKDPNEKALLIQKQQQMPPMRTGQALRQYVRSLCNSSFMQPFYAMLVLTLDVSLNYKMQARMFVEETWNTSWGGGKVVNCLLFEAELSPPRAS